MLLSDIIDISSTIILEFNSPSDQLEKK